MKEFSLGDKAFFCPPEHMLLSHINLSVDGGFWVHSEHFLVFLSFCHLRQSIPCPCSSVSFCFLSVFLVRVLT